MTANLRGLRTRPYRHVHDASEYLSMSISRTPNPTLGVPLSPLKLAQTLDYLSYVLAAHSAWPSGTRLVHAPDLQSALTIGQSVGSQEEFENRLAALWNIINRLQTPDIPTGKLRRGQPQSSLNSLHYWLEQNISNPVPPRARSAIDALRDVGNIRHANAHGSVETRRKGAEANIRFGLPEYISDWSSAWLSVQARLANELDALRQEVQLATP